MKVILYGSSLNPDEDLPKLCPRLGFNETHASISGVNGTSANYKCEMTEGKKWVKDCKYLGDNRGKSNAIVIF